MIRSLFKANVTSIRKLGRLQFIKAESDFVKLSSTYQKSFQIKCSVFKADDLTKYTQLMESQGGEYVVGWEMK